VDYALPCVNLVTGSFARQRPVPQRDNRQAVFGPTKSDCARQDLAPADYFLFRKVQSNFKGRPFDMILDIQKAVTNTLHTIANDDFHKGIQKLYDRANMCVQLEGMYVGN